MTRIAFASDLHVDEYGSRTDTATGLNARLVDHLNTLTWVGADAAARECEALVVAGDFTERRHPSPWLVTRIRNALSAGPDRQVYLRGNHDGERAGGSIVTVLDDGTESAYDDGQRTGVAVPRLVSIAPDVVLACIPYVDRHNLRAVPGYEAVPEAKVYQALGQYYLDIARGLYVEAAGDYPDAGAVLVVHQTLAGAHLSESQRAFLGDQQLVVNVEDLAAIGFVGIVAGHLHRHQVLSAKPPVLYVGSIEGNDFGEEGETKGYVVADVGPGRFEWEFVPTPARRYLTLRDNGTYTRADIDGAIVRCLDVDPSQDLASFRRDLLEAGAFEVRELRHQPAPAAAAAGGIAESLTAEQALDSYFADEPDRDALVELGREILAEVAT